MEAVKIGFVVVAALYGVATWTWLYLRYRTMVAEVQRKIEWHVMWTERIMDETEKRDEHPGPP